LWQTLLSQPVFTTGRRTWQWIDVVLDAMRRGEWSGFERLVTEGVACEACADATGQQPSSADIERVGNEFRYAHDLLAVADLSKWLDARDLSLDDWFGHLARVVLRQQWRSRLPAVVEAHPPSREARLAAAPVDALCSTTVQQLAESLAGRAAVVCQEPGAADLPVTATPEAGWLPWDDVWFGSWPMADLRRRAGWIDVIADGYSRITGEAATEAAIESQVHRHRLEWTRVELRSLCYADEDAAREALLCLREDRMTPTEVASVSGGRIAANVCLLASLDPACRPAVLSASCEEPLGPYRTGEGWEVLTVVGKSLPEGDDPEVRALARAAVLEALTAAARGQVRWELPVCRSK
jgi:hypothetical protein